MTERERLIELLDKKYDHFCDQCGVNKDSHYTDSLADYLLANGVVVLPCKLNLPDELYRHMFDDNYKKIVVKCKVVKVTGYGFVLRHYDGREWQYKYDRIGKTVFLTKEEAEKALKEREDNE